MAYVRRLETLARGCLPPARAPYQPFRAKKCCKLAISDYHALLTTAAKNGHVDCCKYLMTFVEPTVDTAVAAAASDVETVKLIVDRLGKTSDAFIAYSKRIMKSACKYNNRQVVEYLKKFSRSACDHYTTKYGRFRNLPAVKNTANNDVFMKTAVKSGNLFVLDWMRNNDMINVPGLVTAACEYGKLDVLKFALGLGGKVTLEDVEEAYYTNHTDCLITALENYGKLPDDFKHTFTKTMIMRGDTSAVNHLYRTGNLASDSIIPNACRYGRLEVVRMYADALTFSEDDLLEAVKNEHLDCVRYLMEKKPVISASGTYTVLRYLVAEDATDAFKDATVNKLVVRFACFDGRLDILKFLARERGVQLDAVNFKILLEKDYEECIEYALDTDHSLLDVEMVLDNLDRCFRCLPVILDRCSVTDRMEIMCAAMEMQHPFVNTVRPDFETACYAAANNRLDAFIYYGATYALSEDEMKVLVTRAVANDNWEILDFMKEYVDARHAVAECIAHGSIKCLDIMRSLVADCIAKTS